MVFTGLIQSTRLMRLYRMCGIHRVCRGVIVYRIVFLEFQGLVGLSGLIELIGFVGFRLLLKGQGLGLGPLGRDYLWCFLECVRFFCSLSFSPNFDMETHPARSSRKI